jgi:hypothetical protein
LSETGIVDPVGDVTFAVSAAASLSDQVLAQQLMQLGLD